MSKTTRDLARQIRVDSLRMVHRARASHIGSVLSIADILAVLYAAVLDVEKAAPVGPVARSACVPDQPTPEAFELPCERVWQAVRRPSRVSKSWPNAP